MSAVSLAEEICDLRQQLKNGKMSESEFRKELDKMLIDYGGGGEGIEKNHLDVEAGNAMDSAKKELLSQEHKKRKELMRAAKGSGMGPTGQQQPPSPPKQLRVSDVQFKSILGEGAFGKVFLALRRDTGAFVAVKHITFEKGVSAGEVQKVVNEIKLMKEISGHRNITKYLSAERRLGQDGIPELFIFMEYVPGGSLSSVAQASHIVAHNTTPLTAVTDQSKKGFSDGNQDAGLDEETVRQYTYQMVVGLAHLHSKSIIHRDIKGDNTLVDVDGCVKLADFGTAAYVNQCKVQCGTPYFMAPEVTFCPEDVHGHGKKVDIWSLGVTVIQLLNGSPPLLNSNPDAVEVMFGVAAGVLDPLSEVPDYASDAFKNFVSSCLQREPDLRPSVEELLQHEWLRDVSIENQ